MVLAVGHNMCYMMAEVKYATAKNTNSKVISGHDHIFLLILNIFFTEASYQLCFFLLRFGYFF